MNNTPKVAVIGTIYGLLIYLLHSSEDQFLNTTFFLNKKYSSCAEKLPVCILLENKEPESDSCTWWWNFCSLLWGGVLRIKRGTIWRKYFINSEIFAQDQFSFASALIGNDDYVLISDGFNDFACHISSDLYEISSSWRSSLNLKKRVLKFFFGPIWMGWFGLTNQCRGLLHENPQQIPYALRTLDLLKVDFKEKWSEASEGKKKYICDIFGVTETDIREITSKKVLLLAQPFEKTDLAEEALVEIYKNALRAYKPSEVIIKTHPLSTLDYKKHFPDYFVFEKNIPMQLLVLCGVQNISHVITINSTAVSMFSRDVNIVWLGTDCHPDLFKHYGRSLKEEVLYCSQRT